MNSGLASLRQHRLILVSLSDCRLLIISQILFAHYVKGEKEFEYCFMCWVIWVKCVCWTCFFGHSELVSESCQLCVLTAFGVNLVLIRLKSVIWSDPEQLENYGYSS